MANNVNLNSSSANFGISTENPQATGQGNSVSGSPQNPQSLVTTNSINTQLSSAKTIPLEPTELSTSAIKPAQTDHSISLAAFIPIAILVVIALASCVYIYLNSKKSLVKS